MRCDAMLTQSVGTDIPRPSKVQAKFANLPTCQHMIDMYLVVEGASTPTPVKRTKVESFLCWLSGCLWV